MAAYPQSHGSQQLSNAPKPKRRFQFIDNNNITSMGSNSTQVRRHVMQEYMREKRWEARSKLEDSPEAEPIIHKNKVNKARTQRQIHHRRPKGPTRSTLPSATTPRSPSAAQFVEELDRIDPAAPEKQNDTTTPFILRPDDFAKVADLLPNSLRRTASSPINCSEKWCPTKSDTATTASLLSYGLEPQSLLSAARTDPFNCLPMNLRRQEQELFDFYAVEMPACSYGYERRTSHAHNWYLSVFIPEAMKAAVCFQNIILVHAANTLAWVRGLAETSLSIQHRARASSLLREHLQKSPHDISDSAIIATISAAALEDLDPRIARRTFSWAHWHAVVQKIRDRGGPAALDRNDRLQMLINWTDYTFSGYNAYGASFYFDHESSSRHSNDLEGESIARREVGEQCAEFITFLKCVEHLALVQANMKHFSVVRRQQFLRYSVFEPGQPLFNLVASPNGPRCTQTGQFTQTISRLAALMTINTAIWEYRHSADLSEAFFEELMENIKCNELDKHISVEALIQILLTGNKDPSLQHTERPWFVGRMIKIAKRLSRPTFEKLNDVLLRFLTLGPNLEPVMVEWETQVQMEILQAPLVSLVLPFMQD